MISTYQDTEHGLQPADGFQAGTWIHVEDPTDEEVARLERELAVPRIFVNAALDQREVARTDSRRDFHMVIVRAPYDFGDRERAPFRTVPLAMIVGQDHFITISKHPIHFVQDLNYGYEEGELPTRRVNKMILAILGVVGEWFLRYLEELDRRFEDVEDRLADSIENSEMLELLRYEKSLVYMKTGLEWNDAMVQHLHDKEHFDWTADELELLDDVQIEYQQGFLMAETMQTVLGEMTDAFASLISNNLNVVMKFLAAITIVLTMPAIISSLYGMNVALPGESTWAAFVAVLVVSVVLSVAVGWWFHRQGWLSFRWQAGRAGRAFAETREPEVDDADA